MGYTRTVRGSKVDVNLLPKVKFEVVVSGSQWVEKTVETIRNAAYTVNRGDGKIFVSDVENVVRIRTGEEGYDALQSDE